jgi:O-antigen ligase
MYRIQIYTLYTAMFLIAFPSLRVGNAPISFADVLLILLFMSLLLEAFSGKKIGIAAHSIVIVWLISGCFIVIGLLVSNLLHSVGSLSSFSRIAQYAFSYLLVPITLAVLFQRTPAEQALLWCVWGFFASAAIAVATAMLSPDLYRGLVEVGFFPVGDRVGGFVGPNGLAKTIALLIPYLLWKISTERSYPVKYTVVFLVFTLGVIGAASVAGVSAFGIAIVLTLLAFPRATLRLIVPVTIVSVVFVAVPLSALTNEKVAASLERLSKAWEMGGVIGSPSYEIRTWLVEEAKGFIQESPLIGIGAGRYEHLSLFGIQVHNTYLLLWCEGGIVALMGFLTFATLPAAHAIFGRVSRMPPGRKVLSAVPHAYLLLIVSIIFCMNVSTNTNSFSRFTVVPFLLMVFYYIEKERERSEMALQTSTSRHGRVYGASG